MQVIETSNSGFVFKAENQAAKQSWIGAISTWSIIKIAQSSRPIKIFEWKGIKICLIIILVQLNHIHSNTLKEKLCFDLREAPSSRANRHRGFIFDLLWSWQLLFKIHIDKDEIEKSAIPPACSNRSNPLTSQQGEMLDPSCEQTLERVFIFAEGNAGVVWIKCSYAGEAKRKLIHHDQQCSSWIIRQFRQS